MRRTVQAGPESRQGLWRRGPVVRILASAAGQSGIPPVSCDALVDTGAWPSYLDVAVVRQLRLTPVDVASPASLLQHPKRRLNIYAARIHIAALDLSRVAAYPALDFKAAGLPYDALIGRDFLGELTMTYDGPSGSVVLCRDFEQPPLPDAGSQLRPAPTR